MKLYVFCLFLLCTISTAIGQIKKGENCKMCNKAYHEHKNPYNISLKRELPYLITGTALAASSYFIFHNDKVTPYTVEEVNNLNRNDVNSFDRSATYNNSNSAKNASDIILFGSLVLMPSAFLYHHHTREDIGSLLVLTYEVLSITYGVTNIVKSVANRTRPYAYNPNLSYEERTDRESRFSFFSGHTSATASLSFLWAKVMTDYHPDMARGYKIGIWSFAALLPATTGYLRVKAGKHYPTDVITGYAVGAATGWLIPQMHLNKNDNVNFFTGRMYDVSTIGLSLKF